MLEVQNIPLSMSTNGSLSGPFTVQEAYASDLVPWWEWCHLLVHANQGNQTITKHNLGNTMPPGADDEETS